MDHTGIDVHQTESQLCILGARSDLIERRVRTTPERFADVLGARLRARILLEASTAARHEEGRVPIARWNPKGLRRTSGP